MRKNIYRSRRQYENVPARVNMGKTLQCSLFEWRGCVLIFGPYVSYLLPCHRLRQNCTFKQRTYLAPRCTVSESLESGPGLAAFSAAGPLNSCVECVCWDCR